MSSRFPLTLTLSLLIVAGGPGSLPATVAKAVPFDQKVNDADSIVLGKVVGSRSELAADGRFIVTHTTLEIGQTLKGSEPQRLVVTTPGGSVGDLHQRSIGIPDFQVGEEKLLFLRRGQGGVVAPLYFDQGTYDVVRGSGGVVVRPVPSGAVLIDSQTGLATSAGEPPRTLASFESSVRQVSARHQMQGLSPSPSEETPTGVISRARDWMSDHGLLLALLAGGIAVASFVLLRRR